jgi:hypothetical protein
VRLLAGVILLASLAIIGKTALAIGPDHYGYTATTTTFNFEDLTEPGFAPTAMLDNGNDVAVTIPIGFSFTFYGKTYTSLSVSSNGLITFQGSSVDALPVDLTKKAPAADLPTIAVFWHDWTFEYFGSDRGYYQTLGTPGNRRLIVQWNFTISNTGPGNDTVTFEAKLFEGSNDIEFHYRDATVIDDLNVSNGKNATVGIRDTAGQVSTRNLQWSFNQVVIQDGSAILFAAPDFRISSIQRLSSGHMFLQCHGEPSVANTIQFSPDLATWTSLPHVTADATGFFTYEDVSPGARRFYRLLLQ